MPDGQKLFSQERLRQIAWEIGYLYPIPLTIDYIALFMIHPRLAHVHWNIREESVPPTLIGPGKPTPSMIVRVYDVTDILFDGLTTQGFFDLEVGALRGKTYFEIDQPERKYLAGAGFRLADGSFHLAAHSKAADFVPGYPIGNDRTAERVDGSAIKKESISD